MRLTFLNLVSAIGSLVGALVLMMLGQVVSGLIWIAASIVWLSLAVAVLRDPSAEPNPVRRMLRRLSRLLMFS